MCIRDRTYRSTVSRSTDKAVKGAQQTEKTIKQTARSGKKTVKTAANGTVKTTQKSVKTAKATSKACLLYTSIRFALAKGVVTYGLELMMALFNICLLYTSSTSGRQTE